MILYHLSTNLFHSGDFSPRIPQKRINDENDYTPRVCVSNSIEGCLSSFPEGGNNLDSILDLQKGYLCLMKIDTQALNIPNSNIITPDTLYKNEDVIDATFTGEHWITTAFKVPKEDQQWIKLISYDSFLRTIASPASTKEIYQLYNKKIEEEYDGDIQLFFDAEQHLFPDEMKSATVSTIKNADIAFEVSNVDQHVFFHNTSPKNLLFHAQTVCSKIKVIEQSVEECSFLVPANTKLRQLFWSDLNMSSVSYSF